MKERKKTGRKKKKKERKIDRIERKKIAQTASHLRRLQNRCGICRRKNSKDDLKCFTISADKENVKVLKLFIFPNRCFKVR